MKSRDGLLVKFKRQFFKKFKKNEWQEDTMKVLGLNGWIERGHDGGASLIIDGKLISAVEEERFINLRHAYDKMPIESIKWILNEAKITLDDIDSINFGWDYPSLYKMLNKEFMTKEEFSKHLFGTEKYANKINYVPHHLAHSYSAFYPSNYKKALSLVIDGQGEIMGTSIYQAERDKEMTLLMESKVSLGYFYSAITKHVGFHVGEEGKTMGLASYGKPIFASELSKYINQNGGKLWCVFEIEKVSKDEEDVTINKWTEILSTILPVKQGKIISIEDSIMDYANLARSAQEVLENILTGLITYYYNQTKIGNVVISGGVGLNCPSTSAIEMLPFIKDVFVQPAANDGGISLGAAIKGALDLKDKVKIEMIPYTGSSYNNDEILNELQNYKVKYNFEKSIEKKIAQLLAQDKIVANFQGGFEYGPRALGNRSLLASPKTKEMWAKMNILKGREVWRPLAPAVLFDKQAKFFSYKKFSPFMTKNCYVLEDKIEKLWAITHVDGTARIQSVTKRYNSRFYKIIKEYYKLTKIPVVINTSFNVKAQPIVRTPKEAIESAMKMNLDYLSIGNYLVNLK